jgi:hypothetical protein
MSSLGTIWCPRWGNGDQSFSCFLLVGKPQKQGEQNLWYAGEWSLWNGLGARCQVVAWNAGPFPRAAVVERQG